MATPTESVKMGVERGHVVLKQGYDLIEMVPEQARTIGELLQQMADKLEELEDER